MKDGTCTLYLYIAGESFDSDSFNKGLDPSLKGNIGSSNNVEKGITERYWESKEIDVVTEEFVEGILYDLLTSYKPAFLSLRSFDHSVISVNVVVHNNDINSPRGYHFSNELLSLLVEVGAEVDIDIYGPVVE
jgi:hypothetical protein